MRWRACLAACVVRLGSLGWLEFIERAGQKTALKLKQAPSAERLDETGRWLLSALQRWAKDPREIPAWESWRAALWRQAAADGARPQCWFSNLAFPSDDARAARALASRFEGYPGPEGELPATRQEWDRALAYATAFGVASEFLRRAREVNEFHVRHYQGVVVTYCTPSWFVENATAARERFAYLSVALAPLLAHWQWSEVEPA